MRPSQSHSVTSDTAIPMPMRHASLAERGRRSWGTRGKLVEERTSQAQTALCTWDSGFSLMIDLIPAASWARPQPPRPLEDAPRPPTCSVALGAEQCARRWRLLGGSSQPQQTSNLGQGAAGWQGGVGDFGGVSLHAAPMSTPHPRVQRSICIDRPNFPRFGPGRVDGGERGGRWSEPCTV